MRGAAGATNILDLSVLHFAGSSLFSLVDLCGPSTPAYSSMGISLSFRKVPSLVLLWGLSAMSLLPSRSMNF